MQAILDQINATYEQEGFDLPARQYLAVGATAHDCEQLTVSFVQMYAGLPGERADTPQKCNSPRSAVLSVQLVRKVAPPEGARGNLPPDADHITQHTIEKMQDAWLLMDAAMSVVDDYIGALADIAITNESGGYQAVVLNISLGMP